MKRLPFLLTPAAKNYIWGGSRLNDDFCKNIDLYPLAETWECSTHPDGQSMVGNQTLGDFLKSHLEWLGTHPLQTTNERPELPILIKLIDAKHDLSVQVHPDDEYALRHENSLGKTEMWYVLDAKKGSEVIYGFNQDMNPSKLREVVEQGKIGMYLNHVPVEKNDIFFIKAGTVHAIGAGCLIAEIQESSNVTYRIYDYDRSDSNGKKRLIQLNKALEVANTKSSSVPQQPMRLLKYKSGYASELLTRCKYFQVERMIINTEVKRSLVDYKTESNSFHVLLCVEGCGSVSWAESAFNFFKGDCIFVPADSEELKIHGKAQILDISC